MKKIGLYFGTFNPIHIGHLIIAQYFYNETDLYEVWLILSPRSPFKIKETIADDRQRLYMAQLALDGISGIKVSDIEFTLPKPSYSATTLKALKDRYPETEFVLLMGADNVKSIKKWHLYEEVIRKHQIYIYPRPYIRLDADEAELGVFFEKAPLIDISSTYIRDCLKKKKDIRFLLHHKVWNYIDSTGLYR